MQYKKFLNDVEKELQSQLGNEYSFASTEIPKINGGLKHSLTISNGKSDTSPCIRMENFFNEYIQGYSVEEIADKIATVYKNSANERYKTHSFSNWEYVRKRLCCRLINRERNTVLLSKMPHREILDLSIVYYIQIHMSDKTAGIIQIMNEHMAYWEIDEDCLYREAMSNMKHNQEAEVQSMDETLADMLGPEWMENCKSPETTQIYVLGHKNYQNGAIEMLNKDLLSKMSDILGKEIIILPSSIHEVLLLPVIGIEGEIANYAKMVQEVNDTHVLPEEILSYHVYRYSQDTGNITIAA